MEQPDILFVVLDSARPDRLSSYGHHRSTTPALDTFARQATVFEQAYTPAPWTLPSHASMFTGLMPSEHGVATWFSDRPTRLPEDVATIATELSEAGYLTAGFSNNPWVGSLTGLDRGFEEFVEWDLEISSSTRPRLHTRTDQLYSRLHSALGTAHRQPIVLLKRRFFTKRLVKRAIRWLDETRDDGQPRFTFLNLMEAHSPYYPSRHAFNSLGLDTPGLLESRLLNTRLLAYTMGRSSLTESQFERIFDYYDASLRYQDRYVGALFEALRSAGSMEDTMVVVCADHGKTLGEFDRDSIPPHYLRWTNTDVPLIIKQPGQDHGRQIEQPAELVRLYEVLNEPTNPPSAALTADGHALVEEYSPHTGRSATEPTCWRALIDGKYRYIRQRDGTGHLFRHGEPVGDEPSLRVWLDNALDGRVDQLEPASGALVAERPADAVERQLSDLGYLD